MPETTSKYWNCECENHYINPSSMTECKICGAIRESSPDSMVTEVEQLLNKIQEKHHE